MRRSLYLQLIGIVSWSRLFAGGSVDELDLEACLDDGTYAWVKAGGVVLVVLSE